MKKIKSKFSEPEIEFIEIGCSEEILLKNSWTSYFSLRPGDDISMDIE